MIRVTRTLTRQMDVIDHRTNQPFVLQLLEGGKLVRIKTKGRPRESRGMTARPPDLDGGRA